MNLQLIKWHQTTHKHCASVNFLILILYYNYVRSHWKNLDAGYLGPLLYNLCNSLCIYNYLKIKYQHALSHKALRNMEDFILMKEALTSQPYILTISGRVCHLSASLLLHYHSSHILLRQSWHITSAARIFLHLACSFPSLLDCVLE